MENKLDKFFSTKVCLSIIFIISILTIVLSNNIYNYEYELSLQDASEYIELANNPRSYFTLPHQGAVRIFPSFIVFLIKQLGFSTEIVFKYLTYFLFIFLNIKIFFLFKEFKIQNFLALSSLGVLIYLNHSVIYTVFNFYQLLDILTYVFIIYFIQVNKKPNLQLLFLISLMSILTKEFLLILAVLLHIKLFLNNKSKKYLISLGLVCLVFLINYNLAASDSLSKESGNLISLSSSYFQLYSNFLNSAYEGLIKNNNIFLFMPFLVFIFSKKFLNILIEHYPLLIYSFIPIGFSVFLFNLVGNNFFRVFYHGYFIICFFSIIFFLKEIENNNNLKILYFISPSFFLIDYCYIYLNTNQSGFFYFFQFQRYELISGFYLFNLLIISIILIRSKSIFTFSKQDDFNKNI